jgi:hypothetical protein
LKIVRWGNRTLGVARGDFICGVGVLRDAPWNRDGEVQFLSLTRRVVYVVRRLSKLDQ